MEFLRVLTKSFWQIFSEMSADSKVGFGLKLVNLMINLILWICYRLCCEWSRSYRYDIDIEYTYLRVNNRYIIFISENIKEFHHYTNSSVETAAAAVNAGVSLEDANLEANVFTHIGEAVLKVLTKISPNHYDWLYSLLNNIIYAGVYWGEYGERGYQSVVFGQNEAWGVWSTWNEPLQKVRATP